MSDIIHFHRVSHRYEGVGDVLSDVTLTLAKGEMAFLTGSSGAGKSTLYWSAQRAGRSWSMARIPPA